MGAGGFQIRLVRVAQPGKSRIVYMLPVSIPEATHASSCRC